METRMNDTYTTWAEVDEALANYEEAEDDIRDAVIEDLLSVYDGANPEQREYIVNSAGEWVRNGETP